MNIINRKTAQPFVVAVAALAIVAVAAVMLLAGGNPAQADTATHSVGDSPLPPQQQAQPTPEACNGNPDDVVSTGHYAYFDAYWDTADKNLVSNPCPPSVSVTTHQEYDDFDNPVGDPVRTVSRSTSPINIGSTILHVPGAADLTLRANDVAKAAEWPFLYPDRVEDDEGTITSAGTPLGRLADPTPDDSTSGDEEWQVWTLPECPHDAAEDPGSVDLCLGFSAALLNPADWEGDIRFEFEAIREPGIDPQNRGAVFLFEDDESGGNAPPTVIWDTFRVNTNQLEVTPGSYAHGNWAFTRPGTYVLSVQVKGRLDKQGSIGRTTRSETVTSLVRYYTFHVGLLADLSVTVPRVSNATPDTGGTVTFDLRATNAGPDVANNTEVEITLPDGLTYDAADATAGTYDSATGVWSVGDLASGAHQDLGLRVNVTDDTHGVPQTLTARVYATEQIGSQVVRELDPRIEDNTANSTVTPTDRPNVNPKFFVERSIAEDAASGTLVGQPVRVKEPDVGNTLTFNLTGDGAADFTVSAVNGDAQIAVGPFSLDYESIASYDLTLEVSDGLDANGNADPSVDDTLPVTINVTDVENEGVTATLRASPTTLDAGGFTTFTLTVAGLPEGEQPRAYGLDTYTGQTFNPATTTPAVTWEIGCAGPGGSVDFVAGVQYHKEGVGLQKILSNRATVTWRGGPGEQNVCNGRRSGS